MPQLCVMILFFLDKDDTKMYTYSVDNLKMESPVDKTTNSYAMGAWFEPCNWLYAKTSSLQLPLG